MSKENLKHRPPFPIETIGVAVAFSPTLSAILGEANRLAKLFNAKLVLIHAGKSTEQKEQELLSLCNSLKLENYALIWEDGNPVETLLKNCKENVVDLLVLGAIEKESLMTTYIGSVSREICRKAKCSVLVLTEPKQEGSTFKRMVVNGSEHPKTKHSLSTAKYFAEHEKSEEIFVVRELQLPTLLISASDGMSDTNDFRENLLLEEDDKAQRLLPYIQSKEIHTEALVIQGKAGHSIATFAKEKKAELLILNSPDHNLSLFDRIFTHDLEYILADIPCNLLLVHSRVEDELLKNSI